jgi:hypothetical protein
MKEEAAMEKAAAQSLLLLWMVSRKISSLGVDSAASHSKVWHELP